jgi:hypothetical protein
MSDKETETFIEFGKCKISVDKAGNLYIENCKEITLNNEEIKFVGRLKKIFEKDKRINNEV